jgi:opacity protein-like surface antigen
VNIRSWLLPSLSVALLVGTATAASAQSGGFYGRIDTGYSFVREFDGADGDDSYIIGAGIGYRFMPNLRADVTIGYRGGYELHQADVIGPGSSADADISSWAAMVSIYYDFTNSSRFTPYLGGGIGASRNKLGTATVSQNGANVGFLEGDTKTSFAWQLSAGTAIRLSPGISLDIGYRYMDMGSFESGDSGVISGSPVGVTGKDDLRAHEIQVGVRFDF